RKVRFPRIVPGRNELARAETNRDAGPARRPPPPSPRRQWPLRSHSHQRGDWLPLRFRTTNRGRVVLLILAGGIASFGPVGGRLVAADPARSPEAAACPAPEGNAVGITLLDALRVASLANLDIAQAREVVEFTRAGRLRANSQILPNLNLGSTYVTHQGQIQRTEGNVINVNRQSLFVGGGPQLVLGLSDALFLPGVASNILLATQAGARRVTNDTLLAVADAYFAVLRARRRVARIDETLDNLL